MKYNNVLRTAANRIKTAPNFLCVEGLMNDAIIDLSGTRNLALVKLKNKETFERIKTLRAYNMRYRRKRIYKLLLSYAPSNIKGCGLYKEFVQRIEK